MGYFAVRAVQGRSDQSDTYLRKEIQFHPDEGKTYDYLAMQ